VLRVESIVAEGGEKERTDWLDRPKTGMRDPLPETPDKRADREIGDAAGQPLAAPPGIADDGPHSEIRWSGGRIAIGSRRVRFSAAEPTSARTSSQIIQ